MKISINYIATLDLGKASQLGYPDSSHPDVTDAKIREIVVRELNDIKIKLDGLSRKDLLSSYMFLKEGVQLLTDSLDKSKDEQKAVVNEDKDDGGVTSSTMPIGADILIFLSEAVEKLKIASK